MSKFVLTAQLQLKAPTNTKQVVNQIRKQLKGVNVNVNVKGTAQANKQVQQLSKNMSNASKQSARMGKNFAASVRRFSAMAIATRAVSLFTNTLSGAIDESIKFERELIKIVQVTGRSAKQLEFLTSSVRNLSTQLGVGSSSLLNVSRVLSQAGLSAKETQVALKTLARTDLAPTFDNIASTAEGAVAIFNQFQKGAAALEAQLGAVNAVAGKFAVEAGDLIAAVRRTGGVFKAAGGDLNELIALFTSVRSTTRESAESIATGLRTIFTRIQRPKTIEFMKQFGVELTDLNGKFVGPFEAVKRLSSALAGLEQGDVTFIKIAEELGGFRQIGKVIPLIQEFRVAQEALNVAQKGSSSLARDAATAQLSLAVKIMRVKEEFLELIDNVTKTPTFQIMAASALGLASALIKVADSLKVILPIITAIAAVKMVKGLGGFAGSIAGALGGKAKGFNKGGFVPGSGNSDSVPAMLTPGEFVVRKKSAQAIGGGALTQMNKYATGGVVGMQSAKVQGNIYRGKLKTAKDSNDKFTDGTHQFTEKDTVTADIRDKPVDPKSLLKGTLAVQRQQAQQFNRLQSKPIQQGELFEDLLARSGTISQGPKYSGKNPLDGTIGSNFAEVKRKKVQDIQILDKRLRHELLHGNKLSGKELTGKGDDIPLTGVTQITPTTTKIPKFAAGGAVGTDTVPALLTPGEFVVNKQSAKSIGYSNLSHMNKYADGGIVSQFKKAGAQTLKSGGKKGGGGLSGLGTVGDSLLGAQMALGLLTPTVDETSGAMTRMAAGGMEAVSTLVSFATTVQMVSVAMKSEMAGSMLKSLKQFRTGLKLGQSGKGGAAFTKGANQIRNARKLGFMDNKQAKSAMGKLQAQKRGSTGFGVNVGKASAKLSKIFPMLSKGFGGVTKLLGTFGGSLGSLAPMLTAAAGPIALIAGAGAIIGGVISGFRDLDNRLKKAVDKGDTGEAQSLAVSKAAEGSFGGLIGGAAAVLGFEESLVKAASFLGGQSVAAIKSDIAAKIQSAKTAKALAEAQKIASEAMKDLEAGTISAAEGLSKIQAKTQEAKTNMQMAEQANAANAAGKSTVGNGAIARNIFTLGGMLGESSGTRNTRIDAENKKRSEEAMGQRQQAFGVEKQMSMSVARSTFSAGGSVDDAKAALGKSSPDALREEAIQKRNAAQRAIKSGDSGSADILKAEADALSAMAKDMDKSLENLNREVQINIKAFKAMNLGLNQSVGAANAMSIGLANLDKKAGQSTLMNSFKVLEGAATSAAVGITKSDFGKAMDEVGGVLDEFGAGGDQIKKFKQNMTATFAAQKASKEGLKKFSQSLQADSGKGLAAMAPEMQVDTLIDNILPKGMPDEVKQQFKDALGGVDIDFNKIAQGDFSQIEEVFGKVGKASLKQVETIMKAENQYRQAVLDITKRRIDAENQLIDAAKKTVDLKLESEKLISEAGGKGLTSGRQRELAIEKGNVGAEAAGVGPLQGATAKDIKKQQAEIRAGQQSVAFKRNLDIGTGAGDMGNMSDEDRQANEQQGSALAKQNAELLATTRSLINIKKQEVNIIKAKNKLEQDSFDALMSGDIDSFFKAQSTQGAIGAIASGNTGDFDADTLKNAFDELKAMQASGATELNGQAIGGSGGLLDKAAQATLTARGMDPAMAAGMANKGVMGSPAEQAANAEIQALAATLPAFGQAEQEAAQMQIDAANKQLEAAGVEKDKAISESMARGGMVYASKGKLIDFSPRGTDTVPAMLTPGEFVVNRRAVQRGNNLNMLRQMNSGAQGAGAATAANMSGGGVVYRANGSTGPESGGGGMGFDSSAMSNFVNVLDNFNNTILKSIEALQSTKFTVQLEPTNINVNLTGGSFLQNLTNKLKDQLLADIGRRFQNLQVNNNGKVVESESEVA